MGNESGTLNNLPKTPVSEMSCGSCHVSFNLFKRKKTCCECSQYFCVDCLKRDYANRRRCYDCHYLHNGHFQRSELQQLRLRSLKQFLHNRHVSTENCREKMDLVELVLKNFGGLSTQREEEEQNRRTQFLLERMRLMASPTEANAPLVIQDMDTAELAEDTPVPVEDPGAVDSSPMPPSYEDLGNIPIVGFATPLSTDELADSSASRGAVNSQAGKPFAMAGAQAGASGGIGIGIGAAPTPLRPSDFAHEAFVRPVPAPDSPTPSSITNSSARSGPLSPTELTNSDARTAPTPATLASSSGLSAASNGVPMPTVSGVTVTHSASFVAAAAGAMPDVDVDLASSALHNTQLRKQSGPLSAHDRPSNALQSPGATGSAMPSVNFRLVDEHAPASEGAHHEDGSEELTHPSLDAQESPGVNDAAPTEQQPQPRTASTLPSSNAHQPTASAEDPDPSAQTVPNQSNEPTQPAPPSTNQSPVPPSAHVTSMVQIGSLEQIETMPVRQLKELLQRYSVDYKGSKEKCELTSKVKQLWEQHQLDSAKVLADDVTDENLCKICMDATVDCVLLNCAHMVCCTPCGRKLAECPVCRCFVVKVVHVFRV